MARATGHRLAGTAATSAAILLITVAGHAAGEGSLPGPAGLAAAGAFAFALTYAVSDRRRGLGWLMAYVLGAQALLHVLLQFASGHAHGASMVPSPGMVAGHVIAAFAASLALAYGADLYDRWVAFLAHALGPRPLVIRRIGGPATARSRTPLTHARLAVLRHHLERRGPPSRHLASACA